MKKTIYILGLLLTSLFACETDFDAKEQGLTFEDLPKYVAFSVNGAGSTLAPIDVAEDGGDTGDQVNVEIPSGTLSDVTVNYTFGGTAVFGTDFTVAGATSSGGSVTIDYNTTPNTDALPFNADITVTLLTDDDKDGDKTLTITITSASNADGDVVIGRGGQDLLKIATVNISDIDCGDVAGVYDATGTILADMIGGSGPYSFEERIVLADCSEEGEYAISDITGGLYTNDYGTQFEVDPAAAVLEFDASIDGPVTWSDVSDQFDGEIIEDPAAPEPSNYDATNGIITIYWTATTNNERGVTVFTIDTLY